MIVGADFGDSDCRDSGFAMITLEKSRMNRANPLTTSLNDPGGMLLISIIKKEI